MVPFFVAAAAVSLGPTTLALLLDRETEEEWEHHKALRRRNDNLLGQFDDSSRHEQTRELAARRAQLAQELARNRDEACRGFRLRVDIPMQELAVLAASMCADLLNPSIRHQPRGAAASQGGRVYRSHWARDES